MFIDICVVLSYVVLSFLIVSFIGYWTGANYYFKLNSDFLGFLAVFNAIAWAMWLLIMGLETLTNARGYEFAHNFAYGIVGVLNMVIIVFFIAFNLFKWFETSRKYFWNKRGR